MHCIMVIHDLLLLVSTTLLLSKFDGGVAHDYHYIPMVKTSAV